MSSSGAKSVGKEHETIEAVLGRHFSDVRAYRYNSASIRVRIIDPSFAKKTRSERESMVLPLIDDLPQEVQADITMLLLLTAEERATSLMNLEFEDRSRSRL